jgi:cysteinyl-tRNA synthetase
MATALLGDQIDIHCGGVDNIFPHHEAEIAQSEGVTGKKFVNYWLHCAHLLVDGQKMAKSLGNFYTVPDVLEKGYTGRELRYALMRVNYRTQLNFTWDGMKEARESLGRIDDWIERLRGIAENGPSRTGDKRRTPNTEHRIEDSEFEKALDDDLNISAALGFLFETIRETNRAMDESKLDAPTAASWLSWWDRINQTLDFESDGGGLPDEVKKLAEARTQARLAKDFRKSDELRDKLIALGWEARDTKDGQKITRRAGAK